MISVRQQEEGGGSTKKPCGAKKHFHWNTVAARRVSGGKALPLPATEAYIEASALPSLAANQSLPQKLLGRFSDAISAHEPFSLSRHLPPCIAQEAGRA
eukprot:COSAG05_NODE_35_length_27765_cov_221.324719_16_plen_99_part_00